MTLATTLLTSCVLSQIERRASLLWKGATVTKLLANPYVRLAARALVAGLLAAAASYQNAGGGTVVWHAVAVAGAMAFLEVFTPLNALVGVFKTITVTHHKTKAKAK